jgi:hypothetical protein
MKVAVLFFITLISLAGCRPESEDTPMQTESSIIVKASNVGEITTRSIVENEIVEPVVFTGEDIVWFNETTKELRFKNNFSQKHIIEGVLAIGNCFKFYIGSEYLFHSMIYVSDLSSRSYNNLVFYYSIIENRYYLTDGYPTNVSGLPEPQKAQEERDENMRKIAGEWNKFIEQMKKEGRYNN